MARFYEIKRYSDEPILVTPRVGKMVAEAKAGGKESVVIKKNGNDMLIDCKSISAVEESSTEMPTENAYLLGDGFDGSERPAPVTDMDGSVITNWYKKTVGVKEYQSHYKHIPAYKVLSNDANSVTIAFRKPEEYNNLEHNSNIMLCTDDEVKALDRREMVTNAR